MIKKYRNILSLIVTLVFIGVFAWYVSSNWQRFQDLSLTNPWLIIVAAALIIFNLYSIGAIIELAVEPHGVKLRKNEIFGLSVLTRFSKQVTPGYLGVTIRAVYLKKNYGLSYAKFSSSIILSNILQLVISGILALFLYFVSSTNPANTKPIFLIFFIVILFLVLLYLPMSKVKKFLDRLYKKRKNKILERLSAAASEYDNLRSNPKIFYRSLLWMIVIMASSSGILLSFYQALGQNIGVIEAIFIAVLVSWSTIFSITPSAIGIREGLMVIGAQLMGVPIPVTLAVAILMRIVTTLLVTVLSVYYAPRILDTTLLNIRRSKKQS